MYWIHYNILVSSHALHACNEAFFFFWFSENVGFNSPILQPKKKTVFVLYIYIYIYIYFLLLLLFIYFENIIYK